MASETAMEDQLTGSSLHTTDNVHFQQLIENSYDGITLLDKRMQVIYRSPSAIRITGWKAVERAKKPTYDRVHPDDKPALQSLIKDILAHPGEPKTGTLRSRHFDGHYMWIETTYTNRLNEPGINAIVCNFRDITAKKEADDLQQQTIKELYAYKYALDESAIIGITDHKGIIKHVNENFCRISKYSEAELIGQDHRIINSGYHDKAFIKNIWITIGAGKIWKGELKNRAKDGTHYWVDTTIVPFLNEHGKPYRYVAIRSDITEKKHSQEQLQKTIKESYTRSLIEASLDPLVTISAEGKITDVNKDSVKATGVPAEKLIGTDFSDYFTEPDRAEEAYQEAIAKGVVRNRLLAIKHISGKTTDVLYNATVYKDENGNVQGVFASARDITDIKQAEEEIKRSQEYTRSLIEASLDPLVTISPEGKITDVNEASIQATGVAKDDLIGTDFSDYFTEPEKAREGYQQVFAKGFVADYPLTIRHKNGKVTEVLYNASVYTDDKNNVLGVFAAARDITAQRRQEIRINTLNEELEQRIIELESFSYSVSHDLRAPLRGVDGFIAMFLNRYLDKVDDEGQRMLNNVRRNVTKMGSLIDELLTLSRIGMKDIQITTIDMTDLVYTVLEELEDVKGKANIIVRELGFAKGDIALIKQVLVNLVSNAYKYSNKSEHPVIEIGCMVNGLDMHYFVKDNGVGFDMEYSNKLFGVFQRLHDPREYQGIGVGLAIVKRIITRHGGKVWAEGKENVGATFYFSLKKF
jgi:PAS domain S-box-containing protein